MTTHERKLLRFIKRSKWLERRNRRPHKKKSLDEKRVDKHPNTERKLPVPRRFRRKFKSSGTLTYDNKRRKQQRTELINKQIPEILGYIIRNEKSPLNIKDVAKHKYATNGYVEMPANFSVLENPEVSFETFRKILSALLVEDVPWLTIDYNVCSHVDISTQALLDIILLDFCKFRDKCNKISRYGKLFPNIRGINIKEKSVQKMMFSVGSPANLKIQCNEYSDVIRYTLNVHKNDKEADYLKRIEQKELDTSDIADYVIKCLKRMNRKLTPAKRDDLCTVIGEILINAEEHSTTKYRYTMGYFVEENKDNKHFGVFRMVILNFGDTIYDKFKSEDCPNKEIVAKMQSLSKKYTKRLLFKKGLFEEESLWTLYALQEGITSISTEKYKRGNGSIRFIESFFNIKGSKDVDDVSVMTIASGRTRVLFNGFYGIQTKKNELGEDFKVMTFNHSGNIEDQPDDKYVFCANHYFPGTMITAKILLNDDDLKTIQKDEVK